MGKCGRCVVLCCFGFLCEVEFELDVERDDEKMQIPALTCFVGLIICQVLSRLARLQGC